jgi:predicted metal-dependent phosphoesterase TrpH
MLSPVMTDGQTAEQVREPRFPPGRVAGPGRGWYRGDCHVHSSRSHGGELTPAQLAAGARAGGLVFIATTEHNSDTHGAWGEVAGDDLLVMLGQEVTTQTGHWLALGIGPGQAVEWRYGIRHDVISRHLDQVHRAGGLCVAAHPHAP